MNICLRHARFEECDDFYNMIHADMSWKRTDAPYFPYEQPSRELFAEKFLPYCNAKNRRVIDVDGQVVGSVSCYWEHEPSRWLETGIVIYDRAYWGKGIASALMVQWITEVFAMYDVARVGLTTWSGNKGMMTVARKIGLQEEGRMRKVRYVDGIYYDSLRYGVLREEWELLYLPSS